MLVLPFLAAVLLSVPGRPLERPATPTHIDVPAVRSTLDEAHVATFGYRPSRARLAMAVGQVRLEGLALPGHNLGGLEYERNRPWVRVDRLTKLRAFDDYPEAARAYWRLLRERCSGALAAFDSGDPEAVVERLVRCGYFQASPAWYIAGLKSLAR